MAQTFDNRLVRSGRIAALLAVGMVMLGVALPALAANPPAVIVPVVSGNSAYAVARRQLDLFLSESKALRAAYLSMRDSPTAAGLQALEVRWGNVTARIYSTAEFAGIEFLALREIELAVSRSWRGLLSMHAEGLRKGNKELVKLSLGHLAFTESLEALVPQFVR